MRRLVQEPAEAVDPRQCTRCGEVKPLAEFQRWSYSIDGYARQCKTCARQQRHRHREEVPGALDAERARTRQWATANPEVGRARAARYAGQHPLYTIWTQIRQRCENPDNKSYARYGGRGIKLCAEWHDFKVFEAWIEDNLGSRPGGKTRGGAYEYTLDRWPDNDGAYEPGNVRWADRVTQNANRRPVIGPDVLRTAEYALEALGETDPGALAELLSRYAV